MILSDRTLRDHICEYVDFERSACDRDAVLAQINPNSLDLTIDADYMRPKRVNFMWTYGFKREGEAERYAVEGWRKCHDDHHITLLPGQTILAVTREYVTMPSYLCGQIYTKSTLGRMFINHMMAGVVDAGFHGRLTLELRNEGEHNVRIPVGARVVQMIFQRLDVSAEMPYSDRLSRYEKAVTVECAKGERK